MNAGRRTAQDSPLLPTQERSQPSSKIHISIVASQPLLFDVNDIKTARSLGIVGTLTGTLPAAPQQNLFQGVPLQLMLEECLWLVDHGHAFVVPDKQLIKDLFDHLTDDDLQELERLQLKDLESQRQAKRDDYEKKMQKLGVKNSKQDQSLLEQGLSINIPDTPKALPNFALFQHIYCKSPRLQSRIIEKFNVSPLSYSVFSSLRQRGYYLAPGLRFGSHFIGYPGDPFRFHAHLIINPIDHDEDIGLMNIVAGGRLATGVKKLWAIGSQAEEEEEEVKFFSVEWAGFG